MLTSLIICIIIFLARLTNMGKSFLRCDKNCILQDVLEEAFPGFIILDIIKKEILFLNKKAEKLISEVHPELIKDLNNLYSTLIGKIQHPEKNEVEFRHIIKGKVKIIGLTIRRFKERYLTVIFRDITEIVKLQEAIERQNNALRVELMTSTLIHEIANPLANIRAALELLLSNENLPEDVTEIIHRAFKGTDTINNLIRRLRSSSKLLIQKINIKQSINEALQICSTKIKEKKITMDINVDESICALGDQISLNQILRNIIENSIEAIEDGGSIKVTSCYDENSVQIKISDNGPGIEEDIKKHIFTPFFTTKPEGTGLGLPLSLSLAKKMGGDLIVESTPGHGTTVTLSLRRCNEKGNSG